MPRLPRVLVAPVVLAATAVSGIAAIGASTARGELRPRAANEILDALPLPAGSDASGTGSRSRSYVVPATAASVLEFYRTELVPIGWTERSSAPGSTPSSGTTVGRGGSDDLNTDVGGSGTDDEGVDAGSEPSRVGPTRVVFVEPGVRLRIVVRDVNEADATPEANTAASELRIAVTAR